MSKPLRAIKQYSLEGDFIQVFRSMKQLCEELKIDKGHLSRYMNRNKPVQGFIFKYDERVYPKQPVVKDRLWIYGALTETKRKEWYSASQIHVGFPKYFKEMAHITLLDESDFVRKQEFLVQTDDYKYALKNKENFNGVKYRVEKFYNYEDVKRNIDEEFFTDSRYRVISKESNELDDLRSYLANKRALSSTKKVKFAPIKFYGEEVDGIKVEDKSNTFRLYYGLFFQREFITSMFAKAYKVRPNFFDVLMFIFTYKFITFKEFLNCNKRAYKSSSRKTFNWLQEEGWLEKVEYKKSSMYTKNRSYRNKGSNRIYRISDKGIRVAELYVDAILFKRKINYVGYSFSDVSLSTLDISLSKMKLGQHKDMPINYMLYEHIYNYVNYNAEIKYTDDTMLEFLKKTTSADFAYHPYLYKITGETYLESNGVKSNNTYVKTFLKNSKFGYMGD